MPQTRRGWALLQRGASALPRTLWTHQAHLLTAHAHPAWEKFTLRPPPPPPKKRSRDPGGVSFEQHCPSGSLHSPISSWFSESKQACGHSGPICGGPSTTPPPRCPLSRIFHPPIRPPGPPPSPLHTCMSNTTDSGTPSPGTGNPQKTDTPPPPHTPGG